MSGARATVAFVALAVASCAGGWDDAPLLPGVGDVGGSFSGPVDAAHAWVAVVGAPGTAAAVDARGRFVLARIASGRVSIAASDGLGGTFAREVTVYASRRLELAVATTPGGAVAGFATLDLLARPLPVSLTVEGLPAATISDGDGRFALSGLPPGCHTVVAARPGWTTTRREVCARAGEAVWAPIHLRRDPAAAVPHATCEACTADTDCADGACAALGTGGPRVCTRACATDADCPKGLGCSAFGDGSFCAPRGVACGTFFDTSSGKACGNDDDCGRARDEHARCRGLRCTHVCDDDEQCPEGLVCDDPSSAEGTCL